MTARTRIIIADDHAVFRAGVRALLEAEPDFEIVAEAGDGPAVLRRVMEHEADVLLLDLSLPGGISGPQLAESALSERPGLAITVLTMHEDEYYLRECLVIGVRGYVLKKSSADDLVRAVRATAQGTHFIDPAIACHVVGSYVGKPVTSATPRASTLTLREQEVCHLLAMGHTNSETADKLHISQRTVETHRARIMEKLGIQTRAELVRFAIDNGLLKL